MSFPLWSNASGGPIGDDWTELEFYLRARDEGWEVWFPIYEGFRDGKPLDWGLLEKVALIPDEDWREDDPAYTNRLIAEIFEDHAIAQTPHGETIEENPQTGLLEARPLISQNETYIETCVVTVETAAKRLLTASGSNEYVAIDSVLEILLEEIEADRGNAFSIFNCFSFSYRRIQGAVKDDAILHPDNDARLDRLIEALDKGIADLSGSEYVQEGLANRRRFVEGGAPDLNIGDVAGFAKASALIADGTLKDELVSDLSPRDDTETAEEKAAREVRLFGRLLRIRQYLKNGKLDQAVEYLKQAGSKAEGATKAIKRLKGMVDAFDWIMKFFT